MQQEKGYINGGVRENDCHIYHQKDI